MAATLPPVPTGLGEPGSPGAAQEPSGERLRIAYVHDGLYPYFKGGAERRFGQVAQVLGKRHDVTYITWQYWNGPACIRQAGLRFIGVGAPPSFYGQDGKRTVSEALAFAKGVAAALRKERFDVIDCCATAIPALYGSRLIGLLRKEPLVATWHEYWGDYWQSYLPDRQIVARAAQMIESRAARLANSIIAVSEFTAAKLRMCSPDTPIHTIENGVSLPEVDAVEADPEAPDLLFAGRLIDDKKVDWLLRAFAQVATEHPSLTCGIVGEGPERIHLEALAHALGVSSRVRFYGFVEESQLYSLLKGASIFVLPSVREGFGMTVIEAQACGAVPVVIRAPFNAATALVRHEHDGLISNANVSGLANAIDRLVTDRRLQRELAFNARLSAASRDWNLITDQIEEVYRSVVTQR
jgi:glycosyltransferase involved in cell wall biosynthesis